MSMAATKQLEEHKGHELASSLFYGPVTSRRYGRSLGINILPTNRKTCSFNCVYCQLGWNPKDKKKSRLPATNSILAALKKKIPEYVSQGLDTIALSGNGEPTMHPGFDKIISTILSVVKKSSSKPKIVCLTNGTGLKNLKARRALTKIDECCLKIDANPQRVNLPMKNYDLAKIVQQAKQLKNLVVQSCFFDGRISNVDAKSVREWVAVVSSLKPQRLDVYTISRRTPTRGLRAVTTKTLRGIASKLRRCSSMKVRVCL